MSDLDDKLGEIIEVAYDESGMRGMIEYTIAQIKQAFADEGYEPYQTQFARLHQHLKEMEYFMRERTMTRQEWYDRFQVAKMGVMLETGTQNITRRCVLEAWDKADEAAKRAGGLNE